MTSVRQLSEGITHIEDLPIDAFIATLEKLSSMQGQEKLDGANLWLGRDEDGRLFTSREGKRSGSERRYSEAEWPKVSAFNQFRAAAAALEQVKQELESQLSSGDTVELEVIFGKQPNTVTYGLGGKSYIAFLRGVNGTPDSKAEACSTHLANRQVEAKCDLVDTEDGKDITDKASTMTFQFVSPKKIDSSTLQSAAVSKDLDKLKKFLSRDSGFGMSNMELLTVKLTDIPKEQRSDAKTARTALLAQVQAEYKIPIKQALLDTVVRKVRSGLQDSDDDSGIEGVVLRDPETGDQVKIVDKDIFSAINKFNQSVRGQIASSLTSTDPDAPLTARGGIVGSLRLKIAELLGNRELAKASNVRKVLEPIKGGTPEEAIKNWAGTMTGLDDYQQIKKKVLSLIQETYKELEAKLEEFKEQKDDYRLKLKNGKTLGLSDDTVKATLLSFAEARKDLNEKFDKVKGTKSLAQFLAIFYGGQAKGVFQKIEEGLIVEKNTPLKKWVPPKVNKPAKVPKHPKAKRPVRTRVAGEISLNDYEGKNTFVIVNSYLATVFMAMLMFQEDDKIGMLKLRDRAHYELKEFSIQMSPLNFWGYPIWRATKPEVKRQLQKKTASDLAKITKHIPEAWWKFMHMDFSLDRQVKVDWADHRRTISRLIDLAGVRSDRLNTLLDSMVRWQELTYDEKIKAINQLTSLAQQFVVKSSLFARVRIIQSDMLLNPTGDNPAMLAELKLLRQVTALGEADSSSAGSDVSMPAGQAADAGGGNVADGSQGGQSGNTSNMGGEKAKKIGGVVKRPIVKRKRNPAVKKLTLKFHDPRKEDEHEPA